MTERRDHDGGEGVSGAGVGDRRRRSCSRAGLRPVGRRAGGYEADLADFGVDHHARSSTGIHGLKGLQRENGRKTKKLLLGFGGFWVEDAGF